MDKDKIVHFDDEPRVFNTLDTDFKAEVVASGLKEQGYDPERTLIIRQGDARRGFSKDIDNIHTDYSQYDMTDYLHIDTNRKSMYDELPEGLFHQSIHTRENSKEQVLDEIRIHREEEFFARRFFKPFEIVLDQILVSFQHKERRLDKINIHPDFVRVFADKWPLLPLLSLRQAVMFIKMLPFLEKITTSLQQTGRSIGILLDVPVVIKRGRKTVAVASEETLAPLGKCRLDDTFVIGNTFEDGTFGLRIEVGPIPATRAESFLEGGNDRQILDALIDMLLPADKEIEQKYIVPPAEGCFQLTGQQNISFLGINTYLT